MLEKACLEGYIYASYILSKLSLCSQDKDCKEKGFKKMVNIMTYLGQKGLIKCRKIFTDVMETMG